MAAFSVGKPVLAAALKNRPTPGERRFGYWGALPLSSLTESFPSGLSVGAKGVLPPLQRGLYRFSPEIRGKKPRKKNMGNKRGPPKRPGKTLKKGPPFFVGFFFPYKALSPPP
eukprot:FR740581.1.p2 GENE.FR740581.1~~FR740581.1.p2  ORF type:complete len:113 (+),score=41.81 FR740581.1:851-1189(+)